MKAILLAAGVGKRFGRETQTLPKCLLPLGKNHGNLLSRYFDCFRKLGIKKIVIVCGHKMKTIENECKKSGQNLQTKLIFNREYKKGSILSLYSASRELNKDCLIMDADVYFPVEALQKLTRSRKKNAFLADRHVKSTGEEQMLMAKNGRLVSISKKIDPRLQIIGESIGFLKLGKKSAVLLKQILKNFVKENKVTVEHEETYPVLMKKIKIGFENMDGFFWSEIDFKKDLESIKRHSMLSTIDKTN